MRIIHCADIHLESKMEVNLGSERAKERRAELLSSFARLIERAKELNVKAIIVAGDLFDNKVNTQKSRTYVLSLIKKFPEINFFLLLGNHDGRSYFDEEELPENLKLFSEEWKSYLLAENVVISGIEFNGSNEEVACSSLSLDKNAKNIVVMHGQVSNYKGKNTSQSVLLSELKGKNIDYLALGHLHTYKQEKLDKRGIYCYSGCLEGRGFDEIDEKGFVLLDVTETIKAEFVPFAKRKLLVFEVDISGSDILMDIENRINDSIKGIGAENLVKVVLTGTFTKNTQKDILLLEQRLKERFYYAVIEDNSHIEIDMDGLQADVSLEGEFTRLLLADKKLSEEDRSKLALLGIRALRGEDLIV